MSTGQESKGVGPQVKAFREEKGYSRDKLARLTGLTATTIYRIETGRQGIGRESAYQLANVLGINPQILLAPAS